MTSQSTIQILAGWAFPFTFVLFGAYGCALFARHYWALDIFSHFTIQYALGALILALLFFFSQHYMLAVICLVIFTTNAIETRYYMHNPWLFGSQGNFSNFTIVQYNKLYRNRDYRAVRFWLQKIAPTTDMIMVQESGQDTIEELKQFKDLFPYQFPTNPEERFNDVSILSRAPFSVTGVPVYQGRFTKYASRIEVKKEKFDKPVIIYSYHTVTPLTPAHHAMRNEELRTLAKLIKNETAEQVIASGDWNTTPYSPYYQDFLETSGLYYQNYGILPETTWASFNLFPFLKIPIDHILYNNGVALVNIHAGPARGSDHHSLIASFAVKEK